MSELLPSFSSYNNYDPQIGNELDMHMSVQALFSEFQEQQRNARNDSTIPPLHHPDYLHNNHRHTQSYSDAESTALQMTRLLYGDHTDLAHFERINEGAYYLDGSVIGMQIAMHTLGKDYDAELREAAKYSYLPAIAQGAPIHGQLAYQFTLETGNKNYREFRNRAQDYGHSYPETLLTIAEFMRIPASGRHLYFAGLGRMLQLTDTAQTIYKAAHADFFEHHTQE